MSRTSRKKPSTRRKAPAPPPEPSPEVVVFVPSPPSVSVQRPKSADYEGEKWSRYRTARAGGSASGLQGREELRDLRARLGALDSAHASECAWLRAAAGETALDASGVLEAYARLRKALYAARKAAGLL